MHSFRIHLTVRRLACAALLLGTAACSDPEAPAAGPPTLLVSNPLCDASQCRTAEIRAFVWNFTVPQPPYGFMTVGEVDEPTACLTFPESWNLHVTGPPDSTGAQDTTTFSWTPGDALFVTGMDWSGLGQFGATETFVPADAPGWTLTFSEEDSGGMPFTARVRPADACDPA